MSTYKNSNYFCFMHNNRPFHSSISHKHKHASVVNFKVQGLTFSHHLCTNKIHIFHKQFTKVDSISIAYAQAYIYIINRIAFSVQTKILRHDYCTRDLQSHSHKSIFNFHPRLYVRTKHTICYAEPHSQENDLACRSKYSVKNINIFRLILYVKHCISSTRSLTFQLFPHYSVKMVVELWKWFNVELETMRSIQSYRRQTAKRRLSSVENYGFIVCKL